MIDSFRGIRKLSPQVVSDSSVQALWAGTFIALGSSYLNDKTDNIKHLPENVWLNDDAWQFTFKNEETVVQLEGRNDKGLILKLPNPHSRGDSVIVCEGIGEWGTSGSAWFLSRHWKQLSRRFGDKPFPIVLNVTVGNDQSAHEILARGDELPQWSISRWIRDEKASMLVPSWCQTYPPVQVTRTLTHASSSLFDGDRSSWVF